jgi:hypothetical protein
VSRGSSCPQLKLPGRRAAGPPGYRVSRAPVHALGEQAVPAGAAHLARAAHRRPSGGAHRGPGGGGGADARRPPPLRLPLLAVAAAAAAESGRSARIVFKRSTTPGPNGSEATTNWPPGSAGSPGRCRSAIRPTAHTRRPIRDQAAASLGRSSGSRGPPSRRVLEDHRRLATASPGMGGRHKRPGDDEFLLPEVRDLPAAAETNFPVT